MLCAKQGAKRVHPKRENLSRNKQENVEEIDNTERDWDLQAVKKASNNAPSHPMGRVLRNNGVEEANVSKGGRWIEGKDRGKGISRLAVGKKN